MKWIEILRNGNCVLLQSVSDTQYCVACGYDPTQPEDQQWCYGTYFTYQSEVQKAESLSNALEKFRYETEVVGFREVSDYYVSERRKIIEKYESKHGKGSIEDDFTMGSILSLSTLQNEAEEE